MPVDRPRPAADVTIRPYVTGVDEALRVDIYNRAHATDEDFVPTTIEEVRRWAQHPDAAHSYRFIAELDGVPVGIALAEIEPEQAEPRGFIGGPHVVPEYRRRGVGTACPSGLGSALPIARSPTARNSDQTRRRNEQDS